MTRAPASRTRFRGRAVGAALIAALAAALLVYTLKAGSNPSIAGRPPEARPVLMLLTSLPLVFGEQFGLDGGGSPALKALESRYRVAPISIADRQNLTGGGLLLMAQPLAQPAEALVELDAWVRDGGRLLLLADPALEWGSQRPMGDPLRPQPMFADTGLLRHWGLRLDAPDKRGLKAMKIEEIETLTKSPGRLFGDTCRISENRLVANCSIGAGSVTVIADADFLAVDQLEPTQDNLAALLAALAALERK